jgi:predicted transcriptional regulator
MSIELKDWEKGEEAGTRNEKRQEKVMEYLGTDRDRAYTVKEIASDLDINTTTVNQCLYALEKKGLVARRKVARPEGGRALLYWKALKNEEKTDEMDAR